jgi:antitoxin VapB
MVDIIEDLLVTSRKTATDQPTAKLFQHGRSQAVRLPKEFRLPGKEVRVRRLGSAVVLEPIGTPFDIDAWFAALDAYADVPFMPKGREQPAMPKDDDSLKWD